MLRPWGGRAGERERESSLRSLDMYVDKQWPFLSGDMHDFFVGLMGKRNSQPGRVHPVGGSGYC